MSFRRATRRQPVARMERSGMRECRPGFRFAPSGLPGAFHRMTSPIQIRMGGYGPASTGFSRSLKFIGDRLEKQFGDRVQVKYVWNIMDFGYKAEDILWLVEHGLLTLGYQSSSYLTDRVPELGFVDLPFLFATNAQARGAMDGALGEFLARKTEERINY